MPQRIFLTGASGFVGRRLLALLQGTAHHVVALERNGQVISPRHAITIARGDLRDPESYREALKNCDVVVHLAAATGRATADEHHRVNAQGTADLIAACRAAGVSRMLFVSSIAVTFPDLRGYPYALAKAEAEQMVRASGLRFLIVRPTMILGPGAPLLTPLEKLALLPFAVVPGSGRPMVQPVHVDDVARALLAVIDADAFGDETVDFGGPERISIEQLLRKIRLLRQGTDGPVLRVPLPLLQVPLRIAEAIGLGGALPTTSGQLMSFRFDGIVRTIPAGFPVERGEIDLDTMIGGHQTVSSDARGLDAECDVFSRYLLGREANDYVRDKYRAAHASRGLKGHTAFDGFLVRFAARGPVWTKLADSYAAVFARAALIRKKLVILLAILETCRPYYQEIDAPVGGNPARAWARLVVTGMLATISLAAGALLLVPAQLVLSGRSGVTRDT